MANIFGIGSSFVLFSCGRVPKRPCRQLVSRLEDQEPVHAMPNRWGGVLFLVILRQLTFQNQHAIVRRQQRSVNNRHILVTNGKSSWWRWTRPCEMDTDSEIVEKKEFMVEMDTASEGDRGNKFVFRRFLWIGIRKRNMCVRILAFILGARFESQKFGLKIKQVTVDVLQSEQGMFGLCRSLLKAMMMP